RGSGRAIDRSLVGSALVPRHRTGRPALACYVGTPVAQRCYVGTRIATTPPIPRGVTQVRGRPTAAASRRARRAARPAPDATKAQAEGAGGPPGSTLRAQPDSGRGTSPAEGRLVRSA